VYFEVEYRIQIQCIDKCILKLNTGFKYSVLTSVF